MNESQPELRYWVDQVCEAVEKLHPTGPLRICSGITPSGPYHIGHSREVLVPDAIVRGMRERGRQIEHIHFVDDFDALRKRYPYLTEDFEQEVGRPVYAVKAPDGKSVSYAEQFFEPYFEATQKLGIEMQVIHMHKEYQKGTFADLITKSLQKRDEIAAILHRVGGRAVDADWQPIQILDETSGSLRTAKFIGFDPQAGLVSYLGSDNKEYQADIRKGQVKLDWRVHWPAWWTIWGNQVEGFGREHATKGGSYDTGKAIAEEVFGIKAPLPVPYETINLKGETKKMSSSIGNLVSIDDGLKIIPPEILRYFTFKSKPEKQIFFDPAQGLYTLVDEYAKTESETLAGEEPEFKRAWQIASLSGKDHVVSTVPFSHLVMCYQTAQGDVAKVFEILNRTGHAEAVKTQAKSIERELGYVERWLERYAPDTVKFEVQKTLPKVELSTEEKTFATELANQLSSDMSDAEKVHQAVYDTATKLGLKPAVGFKVVYLLFLNKDHGPKVGFFLSSLEKDFVIKRLNQAG